MKPQAGAGIIAPTQAIANDRRKDETYVQYGKRMCGLVNASDATLLPFLQSIYMQEKWAQIKDEKVQEELRRQTQIEIVELETQIEQQTNSLNNVEQQIQDSQSKVDKLRTEVGELKVDQGNKNRTANAKMWLGLIILLPLTVYLFLFYSSTFYSAFFDDGGGVLNNGLAAAMFNGQAIPTAWQHMRDGEGIEFFSSSSRQSFSWD